MKRAFLGIFGLLLPLTLSSCGDSAEAFCSSLQLSEARALGVIYQSDELIKVKGFASLTFDEKVERAKASSELTDLWIRMDEVGCPHD
jgi:hypothetical protein